MRFVFFPLGTYGDLKPHLDIGAALQDRGHQVTLASAEPMRERVEHRGLRFESILSSQQHAKFLADPGLWDRRRFFRSFAGNLIVPSLGPILDLVCALPDPQEVTLVASFSGSSGARLAQEVTGARMVSLWLDPASIRSNSAPPSVSGIEILATMPRPVSRILWWLIDRNADHIIGPELARLRRQFKLDRVRSVLQWMVSRTRSVCLFPEWYARRQADWPADSRTVGFPFRSQNNRAGSPILQSLPTEIQDFLQNGKPPIVVTFGTGIIDPQYHFQTAIAVCQSLGERILIVPPAQGGYRPTSSSPDCFVSESQGYFFEALLPRVCAIIHHGGIGTVTQSLAAGTPQLVFPFAHDQPDNGRRLQRLGAGQSISRTSLNVKNAAKALTQLLSPETRRTCSLLAEQIRQHDGIEAACHAIEEP